MAGKKTARLCTDDLLDLDIRHVKRETQLEIGTTFVWSWYRNGRLRDCLALVAEHGGIHLTQVVQTSSGENIQKQVFLTLETTPCHMGGERVWWSCPRCFRRVAVLYDRKGFACRQCHKLSYRCQRETDEDRALRQVNKIRKQLGWVPGWANGFGPKPKRMQMRTFAKTLLLQQQYIDQAVVGISRFLNRFEEQAKRMELNLQKRYR